MKKLRRLGIADATAANAFLETTYLPEHNARFAQAPASAEDFHRRTPSRTALDQAFQLEETRVLSNDWVIRYDTRYFQVARQSHQAPARSTVLVREAVGAIEMRYRGRLMRWTEIPAPPPKVPAPVVPAALRPRRPPGPAHARGRARITRGAAGTPSVNSAPPSWRAREEAYGRCRRRGRADAPTAPCKTRRRVSHSAHRPSSGDISISLRTGTPRFREPHVHGCRRHVRGGGPVLPVPVHLRRWLRADRPHRPAHPGHHVRDGHDAEPGRLRPCARDAARRARWPAVAVRHHARDGLRAGDHVRSGLARWLPVWCSWGPPREASPPT